MDTSMKDKYYGRLHKNNEDYKNATTDFDSQLEDGEYSAKLEKLAIYEPKDTTKLMKLRWQFRIQGTKFDNWTASMFTPLEGTHLGITKSCLETCGFNLVDLTDIFDLIERIPDTNVILRIKVVTDEQYQNTTLLSAIEPHKDKSVDQNITNDKGLNIQGAELFNKAEQHMEEGKQKYEKDFWPADNGATNDKKKEGLVDQNVKPEEVPF